MKKKQKETIRGKSDSELIKLVEKTRTKIAQAQLKRSDEKNTNVVKNLKHELAFIMTILSQRKIEEKRKVNTK